MNKSMFILALAVAATACNNPQDQQNTEEPTAVEPHGETTAQTADLSGKEWKLLTMNGEAVEMDSEFPAEAHLIFDEENNSVTGNGGCNSFGGTLELTGDGEIAISDIVSTQMACPNLDIENQFHEALREAKHYHVASNTLTLHGENHENVVTLQLKDAE